MAFKFYRNQKDSKVHHGLRKKLSEKQIESFILPLLHEKILKSLPPKTIIKKENLLHVTFDDDKVKGKVLFLVNENIAKSIPYSPRRLMYVRKIIRITS